MAHDRQFGRGRNSVELSAYGEACATVAQTSAQGGRPATEYWLSEGQALVVCFFARTANAAAVRRDVADVFIAWRRGQLVSVELPVSAIIPPEAKRT